MSEAKKRKVHSPEFKAKVGLEVPLGDNGERPHQSLRQKTPDVVYRSAIGGGAMIVDKFGGAMEEPLVPLRSTADSSITKARSEATATTQSKAKPGQRRPAAREVVCPA